MGLGNWTTVDVVNYVRVDPPPLLCVADIALLLGIFLSMVVALEDAGAALFVPVAFAYLMFAAIVRGVARKRLAWEVDRAINFEALVTQLKRDLK